MTRVPLYVLVLGVVIAWDAAGGHLSAALSVGVVLAAIGLGHATYAGRGRPAPSRPFDWRRD